MKNLNTVYVIVALVLLVGIIIFAINKTDKSKEIDVMSQLAEPSVSNVENTLENNVVDDNQKKMKATIKTNKGDIVLELFADATPKTVENFAKLAKAGFYDGTKFHRVIENFMIQGGDPQTKDDSLEMRWGTGDPGYKFADEFGPGLSNVVGTISMANSGPNTNGSQFFINVGDNTFLDGKHSVFGKVVEGMDIVMLISQVETKPRDIPVDPVVLEKVTVE